MKNQVHKQANTANKDVEAPTPTLYGSTVALNILPPIAPTISNIKYFHHFPIACSIENPIIKKENRFQNTWKNPEWRIIGAISLCKWPFLLIAYVNFAPLS